jgi:molybdopterin adenylyltransferase
MIMRKIKILSVNISKVKGIKKEPVKSIILDSNGIIEDAHSGNWHRQISMLGVESINKHNEKHNANVGFGEFAENITTEGMELYKATVGDRFVAGDLVLELTQIGKKCHGDSCAIFKESGDCVMPREGIFCKVIKGGELKEGDVLEYLHEE